MKDTLLVIGNGFDKHLNANTSYSDFFNSQYYEDTKNKVSEWISLCKRGKRDSYIINNTDITKYNFSCWDLMFCLNSKSSVNIDEIRWCDIERTIYDSLFSKPNCSSSWNYIKRVIIDGENSFLLTEDNRLSVRGRSDNNILCDYIFAKTKGIQFKDGSSFYDYLLEELHKFEHVFGSYIDMETNNEQYKKDADLLVSVLTKDNTNILLDSFNYSDFSNGQYEIRHINGDFTNPIFGIDIKEEERKKEGIEQFTKTSRRLKQDTFGYSNAKNSVPVPIKKAIVYGHSLNEMDYDYFNYLFTLLNFNSFDPSKMGTVEFVYSIYNDAKKSKIRSEFANKVYNLLNYYEKYTSRMNQHILINLLRFSGKLIIREL